MIIWAGFFAAGGKVGGFLKMGAASLSGVLWAWLAVTLAGLVGAWAGALPIAVAIAAFVMCVQAGWSPLSFIPGTFMGAACLFGTSIDVRSTVICIVVGLVLGFVSEWSAGLITGAGKAAESSDASVANA
ncbi:glutathione-regulated potassium-efflux system protein [Pseudonocardia sp. N23]|nr:glutathione-regulated potassium-efflux system protein [Pseudonocardia sp. N23]